MEMQNTEVTIDLPERTAEKALQLGSGPLEKLNYEVAGWPAADRRLGSDEVPGVIRAELNADIDRDLLARMRDLTPKGMTLQPAITEEEVDDYPALMENVENFTHRVSARRGTLESPSRTSVAWVVASLAILGFLTAMLIVAIAISV
jgi:hypothetical protein